MSQENGPQTALDIIRESVEITRRHTGLASSSGPAAGGSRIDLADSEASSGAPIVHEKDAFKAAKAKIIQSVAQSAAIAVQDSVEMMRNISTVEVTAIGVATAKWIENPANVAYGAIIAESMMVMDQAATTMSTIAEKAAAMLTAFET